MIDSRLEAKIGFDRIRETVGGYCATEYALSRTASEEFLTDAEKIRQRLLLTDEMRLILMFEDAFPLSGYIDAHSFLEPLLKENSSIDQISLGKLKTLLDTTRKILAFFGSIRDDIYPSLKGMSRSVKVYPEVLRRIESIIDKYGEIKDSASEELFTIRRSIKDKEAAVSKRAAAILHQAQAEGIVSEDAAVTIRDGRFLIPVATASKRKLRGFVYDESSTGKTTFIEPAEIVELENDIAELHFAELREIDRILREFTEFFRPYVPDAIAAATYMGETDFIMAKARTALEFAAGIPIISDNGTLSLRKARHPLLERALKRENKQVVPLTATLTPQKHILLISGPNAGGKSVCLKTVGLLQYMFQWGMLIPTSETSELPVFDRLMVSIGDDQSLENDLSTYSSFLSDMRSMLTLSDARTLVLIDEFGSGTEPAAGGAIAEAILAELDRRGTFGVITTHYTNLKLYASSTDTGVINGAMMFDASRIEPLFKLEIGLPGNSFAFELARKMELPETIVKDAELRAGEEFVGIERNLRKIARNRRALDEKLQKVKHADRTLEGLTEKYQKELEDIKSQKKQILDEARKEAEDIVKGAGARVEKTIRDIKEAQAEKEKTKVARQDLQNFVAALGQKKSRDEYIERKLEIIEKRKNREASRRGTGQGTAGSSGTGTAVLSGTGTAAGIPTAKKPEPLKVGEKVKVIASGVAGEVSKVSAKSVTVIIGNVTSTMSPDKLVRISSNEYREATRRDFKPVLQRNDQAITERKLNFRSEIDLRGERVQDALDIITHYIDDAIMLSMPSVRILHGKGTGALREEIQKLLRSTPGVRTVRDEDVRQGGSGITVVEFL